MYPMYVLYYNNDDDDQSYPTQHFSLCIPSFYLVDLSSVQHAGGVGHAYVQTYICTVDKPGVSMCATLYFECSTVLTRHVHACMWRYY